MRSFIPRWLVVIVTAAFATACADSEPVVHPILEPIRTGMPRDAVMSVIGRGRLFALEPADTVRLFRGFRRESINSNGASYMIVWYRDVNGTVNDPIVRDIDTPILFESDTVVALGWDAVESFAAASGVALPPHATGTPIR